MLNLTYLTLLFTVYSIILLKVKAEEKISNEMSSQNITENVHYRILEGIRSREIDYRYQVAIMQLQDNSPYLICYRSNQLVVRHGGVFEPLLSSPQNELRSFHLVVKIFIPRIYSDLSCRKHHNDIAILKVAEAFDLANFARYAKINLPESDADYEGYEATVTGYEPDYAPLKKEQNQFKNLQHVYQLRAMHATVISNEQCQFMADVVLTEGSLCARALNALSQTCFKDDGGPLVRDGIIIGILNDRQCNFKPELFTRVSSYIHFIKTVLNHQTFYDILVL